MTKNILFVVLGMFLMYILLKVLSSKGVTSGGTSKAVMTLLKTQQASNLIRTNEFRELVKTPEFKNVVITLADSELKTLSNVMI